MKLRNITTPTIIIIIIVILKKKKRRLSALGTITKGLVNGPEDLEIRGRVETIQTTELLSSARILIRALVT